MALAFLRFATNGRLLAASENRPSLKAGERGDAVAIVQMALIDLGFAMPKSTNAGRQLPDGVFVSGPERIDGGWDCGASDTGRSGVADRRPIQAA